MTHDTKPISPIRRRMLEDMTLRKLSPKTQATDIRAVINFTRFIKRSPDTASAEDLRKRRQRFLRPAYACRRDLFLYAVPIAGDRPAPIPAAGTIPYRLPG
jgi:hypothetical protein